MILTERKSAVYFQRQSLYKARTGPFAHRDSARLQPKPHVERATTLVQALKFLGNTFHSSTSSPPSLPLFLSTAHSLTHTQGAEWRMFSRTITRFPEAVHHWRLGWECCATVFLAAVATDAALLSGTGCQEHPSTRVQCSLYRHISLVHPFN